MENNNLFFDHSRFPIIWVLLFQFSSAMGFSQQMDKKNLCQKWKLEKYRELDDYYAPEASEAQDFLLLRPDMTFEAVAERTSFSGTWILNTNGTYVELNYGNNEREKLRIRYLTPFTLVVTYDMEHYRYTEVHYHVCE